MSFLPPTYEIPQSQSNGGLYMKLLPGENKIRILSAPITGWLYWTTDDKPCRLRAQPTYKPYDMRQSNQWGNPEKLKHFWALHVFNYAADSVSILELVQASVQQKIVDLYTDEEWGDPRDYNLKIIKTGEKLETEYNVIPLRPQPLPESVRVMVEDKPVCLDALYYGADPFAVNWQKEAREKTLSRIASAQSYATSVGADIPAINFDFDKCELPKLLDYIDDVHSTLANAVIF